MQKENLGYEIEFSSLSLSDIKEIYDYISINLSNPLSARKIIAKIFDDCDDLRFNYTIGIRVSNYTKYPTDYRFFLSGNYSIFYYIGETSIKIVRVLYSKCDFISKLFNISE